MTRRTLAPLLLSLVTATSATAQLRDVTNEDWSGPKSLVGVYLQLAFPQGEFADFVGTGYGLGGHVTFFLDRKHQAGLRLFGSWIEYGRTTETLPLSPSLPGLFVDLTTSNDIFSIGVGPEFHVTRGATRLYLQGGIGASNFATTTSAEGTSNTSPFASSNNFNDWTFAWYGGGGLLLRVKSGRKPIYLDGGLRYQTHGQTRYLREGSIETDAGGNVILDPVQSRTDLLIATLGVQFGL